METSKEDEEEWAEWGDVLVQEFPGPGWEARVGVDFGMVIALVEVGAVDIIGREFLGRKARVGLDTWT